MAKKTREELVEIFKEFGKEDFETILSPQAKIMMHRFPDFPVEHFKAWFKKNYGVISGVHILHYIKDEKGLVEFDSLEQKG